MSTLARTIADPVFAAANPLYVVGRTEEKRSHYVRAAQGWGKESALCGQAPDLPAGWNARSSMKNVCQACHAAACRMPCTVKVAPEFYYNRDRYHAAGVMGK